MAKNSFNQNIFNQINVEGLIRDDEIIKADGGK